MKRLARLKEMRSDEGQKALRPEDLQLVVRERVLEDVNAARERRKHDVVLAALRRGMSDCRVVRPMYGELCFFEHEFRNGGAKEAVFEVRCMDPQNELRLVTSSMEWKALRAAAGMPPAALGVEDDALAGHRVFVMPGESVLLPFKYQSFAVAAVPLAGTGNPDMLARGVLPEMVLRPRSISVSFVNLTDGQTASALEVDVRPRPLVIDRTFRFYAGEFDMFKQRLSLPPVPFAAEGVRAWAPTAPGEASARCSDPDVAVGVAPSRELGARGREEVFIKFKCAAAPEARHFFVMVFKDRLQAHLAETWQVFVHARRRVDMASLVGQTGHTSVVLRGHPTSRRVVAFTSHPDELTVAPAEPFYLPANGLTEMQLSFRPLVPGRLEVLVHVVDADTRELVHPLLVATDARAPTVSRTFDVEIPRGLQVHKKISYTNPYTAPRRFFLRSTHPGLVMFRPDVLELGPNAMRPVGVTLEAAEDWGGAALKAGMTEVLVFVNDDTDTNEECFRLRVRFI